MALIKILDGQLPSLSTYITFTDESINDNSILEVYTDNIEVFPIDISQTGSSVTITFPAVATNTNIKLCVNDISDKLDIVDNYTSTSTTDALSANQGRVLYDLISQGGGTNDYNTLNNKPSINNVTLSGNKSLEDLGINIVDHAEDITYDDTTSGLSATNVQDAIDELEMIKQDSLTAGANITINNNVISSDKTEVNNTLVSTSTTEALSANQGRLLKNNIDNLFDYEDINFSITTSAVGVAGVNIEYTKPTGYKVFTAMITSFNVPHVAVPQIVGLGDGYLGLNLYTTFGGAVDNTGTVRVIYIKE